VDAYRTVAWRIMELCLVGSRILPAFVFINLLNAVTGSGVAAIAAKISSSP